MESMKSLTFTEIETIASNLNSLALNADIKNCSIALTKRGRLWGISGGQCRVYKVVTSKGQIKALRFWKNLIDEVEIRCRAISDYIENNPASYFLDFEFIPDAFMYKGEIFPAILMDWCPALGLKSYIHNHLTEKDVLRKLQNNFISLIREMHFRGISHGDLHHDNIRVNDDGEIVLIDYDSFFVPDLKGMIDNCLGYSGYQLPHAREANKELTPKADYFSELIVYLSIEAMIENPALWKEIDVENQDQSFIFQYSELKNIILSSTYKKLLSLGGDIPVLLKTLEYYLSKRSLNDLEPFYEVNKLEVIPLFTNDLSHFCINCGTEFYSLDDVYCLNCGCKRI